MLLLIFLSIAFFHFSFLLIKSPFKVLISYKFLVHSVHSLTAAFAIFRYIFISRPSPLLSLTHTWPLQSLPLAATTNSNASRAATASASFKSVITTRIVPMDQMNLNVCLERWVIFISLMKKEKTERLYGKYFGGNFHFFTIRREILVLLIGIHQNHVYLQMENLNPCYL